MLAIGLRSFEALYMITVFEGFMIIFGAVSGGCPCRTRPAHKGYSAACWLGAAAKEAARLPTHSRWIPSVAASRARLGASNRPRGDG